MTKKVISKGQFYSLKTYSYILTWNNILLHLKNLLGYYNLNCHIIYSLYKNSSAAA